MTGPVVAVKPLDQVDAELHASLREYLESFASHVPVRRVAVVGNAPLEPSAERAALIDGSDLVFRVNSFVLDEPGDPPRLGTKTDVVTAARSTPLTPWFFRDYTRRAYFLSPGNRRRKVPLATPPSWPEDVAAWPIPNRLVVIPLQELIDPEHRRAWIMPTTGTLSAYFARTMFPDAELVLTGFSFLHDRQQTQWSHQWGDSCPVPPAHKIDQEGELLQSWVDDGSAVFVH